MKKLFISLGILLVTVASIVYFARVQAIDAELQSAYDYAFSAGITTMSSFENADMYGKVTRSAAAKMFANYAKQILKIKPNTGLVCDFSDISGETNEMQRYIKDACQLGLMGLNNDGTPASTFVPRGILTRAQVGTILSRALYGDDYNGGSPRYSLHLQALKKRGIMKSVFMPNIAEMRGYVMLMMMRADKGTTSASNPPRTGNTASGNQSNYSIEQAISDNAQLSTLAFDGLGFLAGNFCSDTFLPPGKVSDFFGFQYLRDTTQAGMGHSTDFVTNAANNVLAILTDTQKAKMIALAKLQADDVNQYAYDRFPLINAFRRQLEGDIPSGTTALSKSAVMEYSADLYELDAKISIARAQLFAEIIKSLTPAQITALDTMKAVGFAGRAALPDQIDKTSLTHDQHVLVMTYASEMFGRYAGDVEADTYFCPERQGDYFGGFYVKDAPAVGNAGYVIDEGITGDKGKQFIDLLSSAQKPIITNIVDTQRTAITTIVEKRRAIATELRKFRNAASIDEDAVIALAREYGALDGEISYYYATAFAEVGNTLTAAQKQQITALRGLTGYACDGAYVYSNKISTPTIENTDFLFK